MSREKVIGPPPDDAAKKVDAALRPKLLAEVIGQQRVRERLQIAVTASRKLNEPLGHILFDGPPGLG
jgi:Holliday junction DNA helicase RuvB